MSHPVADLIDLAINRHLWEGDGDFWESRGLEYSCSAIICVVGSDSNRKKLEAFLVPMGVECRGIAEQFGEIPVGPKRQYARALWLTWAAMIAREEGI